MQNAKIIAQLIKMNNPAMPPPMMTIMDGFASENAYLQTSVFQCNLFIFIMFYWDIKIHMFDFIPSFMSSVSGIGDSIDLCSSVSDQKNLFFVISI